jgi:hypothetical protein
MGRRILMIGITIVREPNMNAAGHLGIKSDLHFYNSISARVKKYVISGLI